MLLDEVGYPPGVRWLEKDLRHILGVRVSSGSDPSDRSIQIIVAPSKTDAASPEQEPECSHWLPLIGHPDGINTHEDRSRMVSAASQRGLHG
jgi:hypothetical protein